MRPQLPFEDEKRVRGDDGAVLACSEAWSWLYSNGFICHHPNSAPEWMTLTRIGRKLYDSGVSLKNWVEEHQFPEEMLHSTLRTTALHLYRQNMFDTAVFEAFKMLEVTIRRAAGLGDDLVGVKLASRAFHPDDGPLADKSTEAGERQALKSLMSGAIGSNKNPQSHRHVGLGAAEAREMIIMASHLLVIVDSRRI